MPVVGFGFLNVLHEIESIIALRRECAWGLIQHSSVDHLTVAVMVNLTAASRIDEIRSRRPPFASLELQLGEVDNSKHVLFLAVCIPHVNTITTKSIHTFLNNSFD